MDYVLANATILPMDGTRDAIENGTILISDGEIVAVGTDVEFDFDEGEVIDLSGKVVMPGIINAHTHLYQTLLRATWEDLSLMPWLEKVYGAADAMRPQDCYIGTQIGAAEAIRSGVTTLCEHQFLSPTHEHTTATIDALLDSGLRTVYARTIMDKGDIVPDSVTEDPKTALGTVERILEEYDTSPMFSVRTGPNTPPINTTTECCRAIQQFREEHPEVGISAHVSESEAVVEQVREEHGYEGVAEYLDDIGLTGPDCVYAHCVHLTDGEITLMADSETAISHNPVSNMMLGDGVAPIAECLEADATVGLGTDGAASNHSQDMVETMKVASMLQKVHAQDPSRIDPHDVVTMATRGGAKALNLEEHVGSIEPGKRADLIVLNLEDGLHNVTLNNLVSQIVHTMKSSDITATMVDGTFLMRDRTLLTCDPEYLRSEGQQIGTKLRERIEELDI